VAKNGTRSSSARGVIQLIREARGRGSVFIHKVEESKGFLRGDEVFQTGRLRDLGAGGGDPSQ